MKILHICILAPYNDYWSYQDNLLPLFHKRLGNEVTVITSNRMHDDGKIVFTKPGQHFLNDGTKVIRVKKAEKGIKRYLNYFNIYKLIENESPDMIMLHGISSVVVFQVCKYIKNNPKCKLIGDNHLDEFIGSHHKGIKGKMFGFFYSVCYKICIKYFYKIYGVTPWRTEYAHNVYGIPYSKLDTLLMGAVDEDIPFDDKEDIRKNVRAQYNIRENEFVFIAGGKIESNKKIDIALDAFKKLQFDNIRLIIFGNMNSETKEVIETKIKNDHRVMYVGFLNSKKINELFLSCDFGLFPGRHSVLWEQAAACGLPCLFQKYVEKGYINIKNNCVDVQNISVDSVYDIMRNILSDKAFYSELLGNSIEVRENFLYSNIAMKSLECMAEGNQK